MIVLVNGPFGIGKSTTAALIAERRNARLIDLELVGTLVRAFGVAPQPDYQDSPVWSALVSTLSDGSSPSDDGAAR